jgi:hypothetical protein
LEGAPIRIAGNLRQFGHLFTALPSGGASLASHMPTLIKVDPTHYIQILNLYGGTDLRYKYTLGDGYWNAERDAQGGSRTRQIILPNEDIVVQDEVIQWRSESHEPLNLWVSVPTETPSSDTVSLQLNAGSWSSPLPIWRVGDRDWFYILYGPFQGGLPIQYRYCRNEQCEIADNAETIIRQFTPSSSRQDLKDTVTAWQWWNESPLESVTSIPEIEPRPDLKVGMEIVPAYQPTWDPYFEDAIFRIAELGANAIIFSPTWLVRQENQIPILEFDPVHSPSYETLQSMIQAAQVHGLEVALHPRLAFPSPGADHWWRQGSRDHTWWTTWFERYRSFLLSYAQLAAETEVQKLIIGGSEISPSLPAGLLASGLPSDVPPDALSKWRGLLAEVRATFRGKIAFELALGEELQNPPAFIEHLDEVHIYWHVPITRDGAESQMEMRQKVRTVLENQVLTDELLREKPISLSVEYLSIQGAASGCILDAGGNCIPASDFDLGASPIPNLKLDLIGQERAISAVISEAYNQPQVSGFYVRRYHPTLALQDLSASINGKPADDLLMQWYTQITRP